MGHFSHKYYTQDNYLFNARKEFKRLDKCSL